MSIIRKLRRGKFIKLGRGRFIETIAKLHPGWHQGPNKTSFNRYPEIFAAAAALLPGALRILSFGCSTGEECVTLADYFPAALIIGTDINPLNLLKARKFQSERIRFVYAVDRVLKRLGTFDAVFCMAVLRTPKRKRIGKHYPFELFEERALFLETLVKPGGILVIHNATYRFSDTAHRGAYETIPVAATCGEAYLPDGITEAKPDGCIFRKFDTSAPIVSSSPVGWYAAGSK
jgi:2-polyprenyl-3-methyl-5-hydroxy-6-metoxy-1,4-benzoquinol methylase